MKLFELMKYVGVDMLKLDVICKVVFYVGLLIDELEYFY